MALQAIAVLKLLEALVLCATGVAALELLRPDIIDSLEDWASLLPLPARSSSTSSSTAASIQVRLVAVRSKAPPSDGQTSTSGASA